MHNPEKPDHKIITTPVTVRFHDIDAMGHVNNAIVYAAGSSVMVWYDYDKKKTVPISDSFKKKITDYCD